MVIGLAADLFGRSIGRGKALLPGNGPFPLVVAGCEQLGHAEVEQLGLALRGHEDVARLEVAVDHQVLVRELHRLRDLEEERQPFA